MLSRAIHRPSRVAALAVLLTVGIGAPLALGSGAALAGHNPTPPSSTVSNPPAQHASPSSTPRDCAFGVLITGPDTDRAFLLPPGQTAPIPPPPTRPTCYPIPSPIPFA